MKIFAALVVVSLLGGCLSASDEVATAAAPVGPQLSLSGTYSSDVEGYGVMRFVPAAERATMSISLDWSWADGAVPAFALQDALVEAVDGRMALTHHSTATSSTIYTYTIDFSNERLAAVVIVVATNVAESRLTVTINNETSPVRPIPWLANGTGSRVALYRALTRPDDRNDGWTVTDQRLGNDDIGRASGDLRLNFSSTVYGYYSISLGSDVTDVPALASLRWNDGEEHSLDSVPAVWSTIGVGHGLEIDYKRTRIAGGVIPYRAFAMHVPWTPAATLVS